MPIKLDTISYELDLKEKLKKVPRSERKEAKELIGVYLLDAILNDTAGSKSPVSGKRFKPLTKDYKKLKKSKGKGTKADLRLNEDMLPKLISKNTVAGVKIEMRTGSEKELAKAFNHNTGDTLPKRDFLPDDGGSAVVPKGKGSDQFRTSIVKGIDDIIEDFL